MLTRFCRPSPGLGPMTPLTGSFCHSSSHNCFCTRSPHRGTSIPSPPLFLTPTPPLCPTPPLALLPSHPASSGMSHVTPFPSAGMVRGNVASCVTAPPSSPPPCPPPTSTAAAAAAIVAATTWGATVGGAAEMGAGSRDTCSGGATAGG
ncbi:unnamed protein product [Closterium sp. NIES-53]